MQLFEILSHTNKIKTIFGRIYYQLSDLIEFAEKSKITATA